MSGHRKLTMAKETLEKKAEVMLGRLCRIDRDIHERQKKMELLMNYQNQYNQQQHLPEQKALPLLYHNFKEFINKIDLAIKNEEKQIEMLQQYREQEYQQFKKLHIKSQGLSKILEKLIEKQKQRDAQLEQFIQDEIARFNANNES